MNHHGPKTPEEAIKEERRRQRWNAFWTPFIALTLLVSSVAMLMVLIQTCQERNLPIPLLPATSPLHRSGPAKAPGPASDHGVAPGGEIMPVPADGQAERIPPAR